MTRRWYEFGKLDVAITTLVLIGAYLIFGWPHGWGWLTVAPGLLIGRALLALLWRQP